MIEASFVSGQPHVRCVVEDTTVPRLGSDEVLRSELVSALCVMRHQMACSRYANHVVPVSFYSLLTVIAISLSA